ncbi:MAG: hypothetical protein IIA55_16215 [Gemmatimonadetes bacterium]|nr:hypothetical protein [Gemmatimonadota bacterium]
MTVSDRGTHMLVYGLAPLRKSEDRSAQNFRLSAVDNPPGREAQTEVLRRSRVSYDRPEDLVAAIRRVAREGMLRDETATRYGTKYIVDGCVSALVGKGRSMIRRA